MLRSDAYPIVTLTWVLLYRHYNDASRAAALHDLFRWCLTDGQQYAAEFGYTPLPPKIRERAFTAVDGL
jgi:phosphate transport system substrate-binding protein